MTNRKHLARHSNFFLPALLIGTPAAMAQTHPPTVSAADSGVEQVVVTARHRAEKAQSVPIAIANVSTKRLSDSGVTSVAQLEKIVPSLQIVQLNPRNTSFNIRGLGNNAAIAIDGIESGVGLYVDGVFYARPAQAAFSFPDLESVQVLRGPQGTLFGKNTTAGAIDVHTLVPQFKPNGEIDLSVGNDGFWQTKATYTAPITDKVAVRVSGLIDSSGGNASIPRDGARLNNPHDRAVRVQILANVSDDLSLRLIADYGRQSENGPAAIPYQVITTLKDGQPFPNGFLGRIDRIGYQVPTYDPRNRNSDDNITPHYTMETGGVSLQADQNLSIGTITSITSWRFWNWDPYNDLDSTGLDVLHAYNITDAQKQASQEFRFTSTPGTVVDFTSGLYYFYQDLPGTSRTAFGTDAGAFIIEPKLPLKFANQIIEGLNVYGHSEAITNSTAAYGQATYHVNDRFDLTAGARLTYEAKQGSYTQYQFGAPSLSGLPPAQATAFQDIRNIFGAPISPWTVHTYDTAFAGTLTGSYKLSTDSLLYASVSRGDKASGINTVELPTGVNPIAKPERVDAYEIGEKTSFFDGHVVFNADLFWSEDTDYQGVQIAPLNANLYATYITNVPKVRTRGLELDGHAVLAPGLGVYFSGAYTDASYESFPRAPCPPEVAGPNAQTCSLTGEQVAGISRWTMSTGGEYSHTAGHIGNADIVAYGGADYSLRSSYNDTASNSAYGEIAGYGLLDLRLGARTEDKRYDIFMWAHNALNTFYLVGRGTTAPITGLVVAIPGDPAMYGITARLKF